MHRTMFPGYTVGADAYDDIAGVCGQYGRKAVIIGGGRKGARRGEGQDTQGDRGLEYRNHRAVYWYGGEASLENVEMLRPKAAGRGHDLPPSAAARPSTPARCSRTTRSGPSSPSRR